MRRSATLAAALLLGTLTFAPADARGQTYPEKTVRIIVPFPAGGATDILGRLIAERLSSAWGKPVVVENVSGAAGGTGTGAARNAPPDRYTPLPPVPATQTLLP